MFVQATTYNWTLAAIAFVSAVVMTATRLHPLAVLAMGALVGLSGFGQS